MAVLTRLRVCWSLLLLLSALTFVSVTGHAQTITGSVRGFITDPTGAVIPNATVTATNEATGVKYPTKTNGDGLYAIRYLPIGRYTVTVAAKGFSDEHTSAFQLEIAQEASINIPMHLAGATSQVTVALDAEPILSTENPTLGVTIDNEMLESMPMNGRDFTVATVAIPGSIHTGGSMNEEPGVNGNRPQANSFFLDGMDIYEQMDGGGFNSNSGAEYVPNPDALQEVRVITSNANAEFSNVNGGQVVAVTKSGTNHMHGNAVISLENYNMNANTWSNKHVSGTPAKLTPYTQTYFGGSVGGPILKNKLFYFADYQGYRWHAGGGTTSSSVIPQAMRNGDFSALPYQLYNNKHVAFTGNQISTALFSPVAKFLFANPKAYPLPNATPTDGIASNNYVGPESSYKRANQGDLKIDWNPSLSDRLNGRLSMMNAVRATTATAVPATFPFSPGPVPYTSVVLNEVHTFSPNLINEARAGFGRAGFLSGAPTDPSGLFGTKGNQNVGLALPQGNVVGFTDQEFGMTNLGVSGQNQIFELNTFSYGDNLSWQRGHHLIKMGAELVRYQTNFYYGGNSGILGSMSYSGAYSGYGAGGYSAIADFVLGYVDTLQTDQNTAQFAAPGLVGQRSWRDGFFIQDDYKIKPNLTLNLGVRYDYTQPLYEVNDKQTNVNLQTGALQYAGKNGNSRALYNPTYDNIQPRLGFAYSFRPKWVMRGGYGITSYFEGMGVNLRLTQNPPWIQAYTLQGTRPSGIGVGTPLPVTTTVPSGTTGSFPGNTYRAWDPNIRPSVSQEYSLTFEYQIDNNSSMQVGYVGEITRHLTIPIWANQWPASCAGASTCAAAPFASSLGQTTAVKETATTASMNYNALQAVYRKHGSKGLDFTANYTYSKAMTNGNLGFNGFWGTSAIWYQQNAFDLNAEYGPSPLDATHNLAASMVYELPFGRGHQFAANINQAADLLLGGWKISGLASVFTGNPVTLTSPNNYGGLLHDVGQDRPNYMRKLHVVNRSTQHWFGTDPSATTCISKIGGGFSSGDPNSCAYSTESYTGFGTAHNGSERGPGFKNIDLSIFKAFRIYEEHRIEFRADAYNSFNFASYGNPDTGVANSSFGQINSTRGIPRTLQLTLNYKF